MLDLPGEFPGVAQKIFEHDPQQGRVGVDPDVSFDDDLDLSLRGAFPQLSHDAHSDPGQIDRVSARFSLRHLRQQQQVVDRQHQKIVDHLSHPPGGLANLPERPEPLRTQIGRVVLDQRLAQTIDSP